MDIYNNLKSIANITLEDDNGSFELSSGGFLLKGKSGADLSQTSLLDLSTKTNERSEKNSNFIVSGSAINFNGWDSGPLTGLPAYNKLLNKVIYVNGRYFAAHSSGAGLYASSNCLDWVKILDGSFLNIIHHNGVFILVGTSGTIYKSTDGFFWENISIPNVGSIYGVTAGELNGTEVIVVTLNETSVNGEAVPFKFAYTEDLKNWTIVDTIPEGATTSRCLEFYEVPSDDGESTEKLFFVCTNEAGLFYSSDLTTWTKVDIPTGIFGDLGINKIKKLDDGYYYVCGVATDGLYRSLNPKYFTEPSLILNCEPAGGAYKEHNWDIGYSKGYYVATQAAGEGGYYWAEESNVDENGVPIFTSSSANDNGISHIKSYNGNVFAVNNFFILTHRGGSANAENGPSLTFMKMPLKKVVSSSDLSDYATISYVDGTFATTTTLGNYIPKSEWTGGVGFGSENFFNLNVANASNKVLNINNLKGNRIHGLKKVTHDNNVTIKLPETNSVLTTLSDFSVSASTFARSDNANTYGWTGLVSALGIEGTDIKITEAIIYRRGGNNPTSGSSRLYLRVLKKVDSTWVLAGQSVNGIVFNNYTEADIAMGPFVINPVSGVTLETTDTIAFVFVSSESADVTSSVQFGAKTTSAIRGGLNAAITSDADTVSTLSYSPVFEVKYFSTKESTGTTTTITDYVDLTSDQTIQGTKTFSTSVTDGTGVLIGNISSDGVEHLWKYDGTGIHWQGGNAVLNSLISSFDVTQISSQTIFANVLTGFTGIAGETQGPSLTIPTSKAGTLALVEDIEEVSSAIPYKGQFVIDTEISSTQQWTKDLSSELASFDGFPLVQIYNNDNGRVIDADIQFDKSTKTLTISTSATIEANLLTVVVYA